MGFFKKLFGGKEDEPKTVAVPAANPATLEKWHTLERDLVVEPFAKIVYEELPGKRRFKVYILMEQGVEGMQTGVAIDGSASMQGPFGRLLLGQPSELEVKNFQQRGLVRRVEKDGGSYNMWSDQAVRELLDRGIFRYSDNIVEPQAREMTAHLSRFDADGGTAAIYWATEDGRGVEVLGDLKGVDCPTTKFRGPKKFGEKTYLLPAIRYFVDRFVDPPLGMYIFITDGALDDLEEVKQYSIQLARQIAAGRRKGVKFVLVGVGKEVKEAQMVELDNLETGTDVDLWDHKIATEMKMLSEIFAEVVSEQVLVAPGAGVIKDARGNVVKDYRDTGLPALIVFELPVDSQWFTLDVGGQVVRQPLVRGV